MSYIIKDGQQIEKLKTRLDIQGFRYHFHPKPTITNLDDCEVTLLVTSWAHSDRVLVELESVVGVLREFDEEYQEISYAYDYTEFSREEDLMILEHACQKLRI